MFADSWRRWLHRPLQAVRGMSVVGRPGKRRRPGLAAQVEGLEDRTTPAVINLSPIADNTLYQVSTASPSQQLSNGAGQHFFVGDTNQPANGIRRGAIKVDVSAVPPGATIN